MTLQKQLENIDKEIQKAISKKEVHEKAFADMVNKLERLKISHKNILDEMNKERNAAMIQVAEIHGINTADALAVVLEKRGGTAEPSRQETPVPQKITEPQKLEEDPDEDGD